MRRVPKKKEFFQGLLQKVQLMNNIAGNVSDLRMQGQQIDEAVNMLAREIANLEEEMNKKITPEELRKRQKMLDELKGNQNNLRMNQIKVDMANLLNQISDDSRIMPKVLENLKKMCEKIIKDFDGMDQDVYRKLIVDRFGK